MLRCATADPWSLQGGLILDSVRTWDQWDRAESALQLPPCWSIYPLELERERKLASGGEGGPGAHKQKKVDKRR